MSNYFRVLYYLFDMMNHPYLSLDKLMKYRNKKLRKVIRHAYDYVPFYHRKFKESGVKPADIATVKDLNKLSILRKDEIRKNLNEIISKRYDVQNLEKHCRVAQQVSPCFSMLAKRRLISERQNT